MNRIFKEIVDWILIIALAFAGAFVIRTFLIQPFRIQMTSMETTLHPDDLIIVDKITYRFSEPKRGDIVVFIPPQDKSNKYIKRVIGLPGETIMIREGRVYINNKPLDEPYLNSGFSYDYSSYKIPDGEIFVMGDNRTVSLDSRSFGPIKISSITGKALFVYWPLHHIEILKANTSFAPQNP